MPDPDVPRFRVSNEGDPVPPADPEDLKRRWNTRKEHLTCEARSAAHSQETDTVTVAHRFRMISMLEGFNHGQLLAPWKHGEALDDAVFRLAATFPIRPLCQNVYKVPGDSMCGFDPNAFVQKLIEETGISHVWKPVSARISEGNWSFVTHRLNNGPADPERETKHAAVGLLWAIWTKCQPYLSRPSGKHQSDSMIIAMLFADFVICNIDLARDFVSGMSGGESRSPLVILSELERRALRSPWEL